MNSHVQKQAKGDEHTDAPGVEGFREDSNCEARVGQLALGSTLRYSTLSPQ